MVLHFSHAASSVVIDGRRRVVERTDASSLTTEEVFGYVAGATPLRKTTTVEDFAKACVFFAAAASDAVTGQSLSVDGGLTMP